MLAFRRGPRYTGSGSSPARGCYVTLASLPDSCFTVLAGTALYRDWRRVSALPFCALGILLKGGGPELLRV
jgi:hypothetical protein